MKRIISGLNVYTANGILSKANVILDQGFISDIHQHKITGAGEQFNFPSTYHLVPGFIDLHVHGVNHHDVMDGTTHALSEMSQALAKEGTTAFLATTMTDSLDSIEKALRTVHARMQHQPENQGAEILGVHLEGPFISPKKAGAQRKDYILAPDIALFKHWQTLSGNHIRLVTLAPELPNSLEFIAYLKQHQIVASIGHTDATFAETEAAIAAGSDYATHLFNAMRGIHQREPGAVTAALLAKQLKTELIVDGIHLHPAIVKLILTLKNKDHIVLATDAMRAKCLSDGTYDLGGQAVFVRGGKATLADGTLAGSTLSMSNAIKNIMQFTDCDLMDAIQMAATNPAAILKISDQKGSITIGKKADLVVLNENLDVVHTFRNGHSIFQLEHDHVPS